ncbi:hypothetical protein [Bartonella gliris]|nr:hypothetical protein [Bartonella gliris]
MHERKALLANLRDSSVTRIFWGTNGSFKTSLSDDWLFVRAIRLRP